MSSRWNYIAKLTPFRCWMAAVVSFWLVTGFVVLLDFAGERWWGISWLTGPDLFPNMLLGYPLALSQMLSAVLLVMSGIRLAHTRTGLKGIGQSVGLIVVTGIICLGAYVLLALWYQTELMGRSL